MKKVLIIAHTFPPFIEVGGIRSFKFAKYLPDFGWKPVILSAKIGSHVKEIDESLLDQLKPCVKIYRVFGIRPRQLYERFSSQRNNSQTKLIKNHNSLYNKNGFIRYLKRFWKTWFEIPDHNIGWFPFALFKALQIIRNHNIDVIYSTSDPFTSHLVALFIKKITKKSWVADFRDPWTQYPLYEKDSDIRKKIDENFEYRFLQKADAVIVTSNLTGVGFVDKYPAIPRKKVITITNGYDPSDFENIITSQDNQRFTITYTGSFFSVSSSNKFLEGVSKFLKKYNIAKSKILIRFVGSIFDAASHRLIYSLELQDVIEVLGYFPYKQFFQYQASSDVLLVTRSNEPGNEVIIPAKIFDYLAHKKPILALVPTSGEAAKLIQETRSGIVVSPDDKDKICEALFKLYSKYNTDGPVIRVNDLVLKKYERKYLTGCFADVLQNVV